MKSLTVFATHKAADHFYFDGIEAEGYLLASGERNEFIRQRHSEGEVLKDKTTRIKNNRSFTFWTVASSKISDKLFCRFDRWSICFCSDMNIMNWRTDIVS